MHLLCWLIGHSYRQVNKTYIAGDKVLSHSERLYCKRCGKVKDITEYDPKRIILTDGSGKKTECAIIKEHDKS